MKCFSFYFFVLFHFVWCQSEHNHECQEGIVIRGCFNTETMATHSWYDLNSKISLTARPKSTSGCPLRHVQTTNWNILNKNGQIVFSSESGPQITIPPLFFKTEGIRKVSLVITEKLFQSNLTVTNQQNCYFLVKKRGSKLYIRGPVRQSWPCQTSYTARLAISNAFKNEYFVSVSCNINSEECQPKELPESLEITYENLICNKEYHFKAKAFDTITSKLSLQFDFYVKTTTAVKSKLELRCMYQCEYKISAYKVFGLHLIENPLTNDSITWGLKINGNPIDVGRVLRQFRSPEYFILKPSPNVFKARDTVEIIAQKSKNEAIYSVIINEPPEKGVCVTNRRTGTSSDVYGVFCMGFKDPDPIDFFLYQLNGEERTLLMRSKISYFQDVKLSSNRIVVIARDFASETSSDVVEFQLTIDENQTLDFLELKRMDDEIALQRIVSFVAANRTIQDEIKLKILKMDFSLIHVKELASEAMKLLTKITEVEAHAEFPLGIGYILEKITKNIGKNEVEDMPEHTYKSLADASSNACNLKDPVVHDVNYPEEIAQLHYRKVKRGTILLINAFENFLRAMAYRSKTLEDEFVYNAGNFMLKSQVIDCSIKNYVIPNPEFIEMLIEFDEDLLKTCDSIIVGFVYILVKRITWWSHEQNQISTPSIIVTIYNFTTKERIRHFPAPVIIYLKSEVESRDVHQLKLKPLKTRDEDLLDFQVYTLTFHFDQYVGTLHTLFFPRDNIKAIITQDVRPSFDMVNSTKNLENANIIFHVKRKQFKHTIVYLGILSTTNVTIDPYLVVSHYSCSILYKGEWNTDYCSATFLKGPDLVMCACNHLSFLTGGFFVPPNHISFDQEEPLNVELFKKNHNILILSGIFSLLFLLALIAVVVQQIRHKNKKNIEILEDNYPGDRWPYLVAVYSGRLLVKANTSRVALRLFGTESFSRIHTLEKQKGKVLRPNSDDWFLIYTRIYLGEIKSVEIWHDDYGNNPEWFCFKILIYDLTTLKEYNFPIGKWFTISDFVDLKNPIEFETKPASKKCRSIAQRDYYRHLRENHRYLSIVDRHPRSVFTISERILLCITFIAIHMMISMMFFGVSSHFHDHSIYDKLKENMLALQNVLISMLLSFIIIILFKQGKVKYSGEFLSESYKSLSEEKNNKCKRFIRKIFSPRLFLPLTPIDQTKPFNSWSIFSWFGASLIFCASITLVTLYGLDFGGRKLNHWMFVFFLGLFQQCFIEPILIFLVLFITSFIWGMTLVEKLNIEPFLNEKINQNKETFTKLLDIRTDAFYTKIFTKNKGYYERKLKNKKLIESIVESSIIFAFFLSLLFIVVFMSIKEKSYSVASLRSFIEYKTEINGSNIQDVYTYSKLGDYILSNLMPGIHKLDWYNGLHLELNENEPNFKARRSEVEKGLSKDYASKLIGTPRIVQRRVKPQYFYGVSGYWKKFYDRSYSHLNVLSEDKNAYSPNWKEYDREKKEKWNHTTYNHHPTRLYSGLYVGGSKTVYKIKDGYVIPLSPYGGKSVRTIVDLYMDGFFNNLTRIVFIEFCLIALNTKTLAQVIISLEHMSNGVYVPHLQIELTMSDLWDLKLIICMACLFIIWGLFSITTTRKALKIGPFKFLKSIHSFNSALIVIFGFISLIFFFLRWSTLEISMEDYFATYATDYISFFVPVEMDFKFALVVGILCCLCSLHFVKFKPKIVQTKCGVSFFFIFIGLIYSLIFIFISLAANTYIEKLNFDRDLTKRKSSKSATYYRIFNLASFAIFLIGFCYGGMVIGAVVKNQRNKLKMEERNGNLSKTTNKIRRRSFINSKIR